MKAKKAGQDPVKCIFSSFFPLFFLYPIFFGRQREGEKGALLGGRYRSGSGLWSCKKKHYCCHGRSGHMRQDKRIGRTQPAHRNNTAACVVLLYSPQAWRSSTWPRPFMIRASPSRFGGCRTQGHRGIRAGRPVSMRGPRPGRGSPIERAGRRKEQVFPFFGERPPRGRPHGGGKTERETRKRGRSGYQHPRQDRGSDPSYARRPRQLRQGTTAASQQRHHFSGKRRIGTRVCVYNLLFAMISRYMRPQGHGMLLKKIKIKIVTRVGGAKRVGRAESIRTL